MFGRQKADVVRLDNRIGFLEFLKMHRRKEVIIVAAAWFVFLLFHLAQSDGWIELTVTSHIVEPIMYLAWPVFLLSELRLWRASMRNIEKDKGETA